MQAFVVAGGYVNVYGPQLSSVLTLLPGAMIWTHLASLPRALDGARASIVGGRLRVTGGANGLISMSEVSDVATDMSTSLKGVGWISATVK